MRMADRQRRRRPQPRRRASGRRFAGRVARDCKLALRSRAELGVQLLFYVIVVSLFPARDVARAQRCSRRIGPGVLWVAALLASLLSLPRLFAADYADGTLEQIALSPYPLAGARVRQDRRALADDGPAGRRCSRRCSGCSTRSTATALAVLARRCCSARRSCRCWARSARR